MDGSVTEVWLRSKCVPFASFHVSSFMCAINHLRSGLKGQRRVCLQFGSSFECDFKRFFLSLFSGGRIGLRAKAAVTRIPESNHRRSVCGSGTRDSSRHRSRFACRHASRYGSRSVTPIKKTGLFRVRGILLTQNRPK